MSRTAENRLSATTLQDLSWVGPSRLRDLLENCMAPDYPWPGEVPGIYFVSERAWHGVPIQECGPLWVGKTSVLLRRMGELLSDMLGFFGNRTGRNPGGWKVWYHCEKQGLHPLDLFIAWTVDPVCPSCEERVVDRLLRPILNDRRPGCQLHWG